MSGNLVVGTASRTTGAGCSCGIDAGDATVVETVIDAPRTVDKTFVPFPSLAVTIPSDIEISALPAPIVLKRTVKINKEFPAIFSDVPPIKVIFPLAMVG